MSKSNGRIEEVEKLWKEKPETKSWPSRTIARFLFGLKDQLPGTIEEWRHTVRYLRQTDGKTKAKTVKSSRPGHDNHEINYKIPESFNDNYLPVTIPIKYDKLGIMNDIHCPFHDEVALGVAIKFFKKNGINCLLLNGDTADQYWTSPFVKRGHKHPFSYREEIDQTRWMLDWIMEELPQTKIIYNIGNHEDRFENFISNYVPEFRDMPDFSLEHLLELKDRGFEVVGSETYLTYGKLKIVHGHEFGRGGSFAPVNMARSLYLKSNQSAICGHGHRSSEHTEVKMDGSVVTCWSIGCLCFLHPPYSPINKWNHGFAYVENVGGNYTVHNKRIHRGKIL